MPSAVLRLALCLSVVLTFTGFAQVFREAIGTARLPRMHQVSPCSTGASRIFAISSVHNRTVLIGGLGRVGWVNDSATNVDWECSPTQDAFVAAAVKSDTLLVGTEFGRVWVRLPNAKWTVVNQKFGSQILDVKVTPRGWFVLTFEGTIHHASTLFDEWNTVTIPLDLEKQRPVKFDVHDSTIVVCQTGGHWSITKDLGAHWQLSADTLARYFQWKSVLALPDGTWYLGGEGASVWKLDSALLTANRRYNLFPVWHDLDAGYRPDAILSLSFVDSVGIVASVNGWRVRMENVNYQGLYVLSPDADTWKFYGFDEHTKEGATVPTDGGVGAFTSAIGELCAVTSESYSGPFVTSIHRLIQNVHSFNVNWTHSAQGKLGYSAGAPTLGWNTETYFGSLSRFDGSVLLTYRELNTEVNQYLANYDSVRVRQVSITSDSIVVADHPPFPPMLAMQQSNAAIFGMTPNGKLIRSVGGSTFEPVTNIPFGLRWVVKLIGRNGVVVVVASTIADADSSRWGGRRLFVTSDDGSSWKVMDMATPPNTRTYITDVALGPNGDVACYLLFQDSSSNENRDHAVCIWSGQGLAHVLPSLPDIINRDRITNRGIVLSYVEKWPELWTTLNVAGEQPETAIITSLVDGEWEVTVPQFVNNGAATIGNQNFTEVLNLTDMRIVGYSFGYWLSTDSCRTFIRLEDAFQHYAKIRGVIQTGNVFITFGEAGILATSSTPLPTSVIVAADVSQNCIGAWECGTPLNPPPTTCIVSLYTITGQLINSINLVDQPNPTLSCESLSGATFALLKNVKGDLLIVKRIIK